MNILKSIRCILFIFCLSFFSNMTHAVAIGETDAEIRKILQERVDVYKKSVGIVVGIVDSNGSKVISYGKRRQGSVEEVDGNSLYEIGSITKGEDGEISHLVLHQNNIDQKAQKRVNR